MAALANPMTVEEALAIAQTILDRERLTTVQELVFRQSWQGRSYQEMAKSCGYDPGYVKDVGSKLWQMLSNALEEKVTKNNFPSVLKRYAQELEAVANNSSLAVTAVSDISLNAPNVKTKAHKSDRSRSGKVAAFVASSPTAQTHQDWGDAIDVSTFYGRTTELLVLQEWILQQKCRLVALLGMGGIGKTALSVKLAERIQEHFDYVIWRSVRNAPPIQELLADLIQFLSHQQEINLPPTIDGQIAVLIKYLRSSRCLIVLDNWETILCGSDTPSGTMRERAGRYREGYEGYDRLLASVGETRHQSTVILTSREKPIGFSFLEGESLPIRSFPMPGLKETEARELFQAKGSFSGSESEWQALIQYYGGNPLALKMVAAAIQDIFGSNISKLLEYLKNGTLVFDDIHDLLARQFNRLSSLEKEVMYWLAINRETVSIDKIQDEILSPESKQKLAEALKFLVGRSLIEKNSDGFSQQPVVMEYVTDHFIDRVCQEIAEADLRQNLEGIQLFCSHALIQAQAKDYVRETQVRLILKPVTERLISNFRSNESLQNRLFEIISTLRGKRSGEIGYAGGNVINILRQMQIDLSGFDFSELTFWQAYLPDANLHGVNFKNANIAKSVFAETLGSILSVAFSPDGKILAISDTNGEIHLWGVGNGKHLLTCKKHNSWVWSIAFSPQGKTLASCSFDETVKLWDVETGQCLKTLRGHTHCIWTVAFSPDGQILASAGDDATVKLWNLSTGECLENLQGHTNMVCSVAFNPQGKMLASGSGDGSIKFWDMATNKCAKTWEAHRVMVRSLAFSLDGKTLASGSYDSTVKLWNVETGECLKTLQGHQNFVLSVAFSADGKTLATGSEDRTVKLWDIETGKCLRTLPGHPDRVWSVAFSPDGKILASGGDSRTVKLWDTTTHQCLKTLQGHITNTICSVSFSPNSSILASGGEDGMVRLWDIHEGKCLKTLPSHTNWIWSVAFSPDGQTLASGGADFSAKLWDVSTGQCRPTTDSHGHHIRDIIFSPDGRIFATAAEDNTVKIWNVRTGQCLNTFQGHSSLVLSVAFSPDGQILASGSGDGTVKLWDVSSGECLKTLFKQTGFVFSIAFHQNGSMLATCGDNNTVQLWDINIGECVKVLPGHTSRVRCVAFSADGEILASGGEDLTVRCWNVETGKCTQILEGHSGLVLSVAFSQDGQIVASGSEDETIKLWYLETGECLNTLRTPRPYEGMNISGVAGLTEAEKATLKMLGAFESEADGYKSAIGQKISHPIG